MNDRINSTRRLALRGIPLLGAALIAPKAVAATMPAKTARERMAFHLAEYQRAVQELDPTIKEWRGGDPKFSNPDGLVVICLTATRRHPGD